MRVLLLIALLGFAAPAAAQDKGQEEPPQPEQGQEDRPLWSQADEHFGEEEMRKAREALIRSQRDDRHSLIMAERLEAQLGDGEENLLWDVQGWTGGDTDKLWVKSEGEYGFSEDRVEDAEFQALWSRAISPYFDFQAGIRADIEPDERAHLVAGIQGLAPYWFEVDAAAFLSDDGDLTARVEGEYDLRVTQRLIAQPRVELNFAAQDIAEIGIGSGLSTVEAGLRLRYEVERQFAPYIGVEWQRDVGGTADFTRAAGGDPDRIAAIAGIRFWF